ncbi:MAG: hypothetical protein IJX04_09500, partial [Oscillospiraceae bacterium]|nr:hypothetical protein [Oscillospiraceae bacterium]
CAAKCIRRQAKTAISLRETRKSQICGGRANVPPLQVFLETGLFDSLSATASAVALPISSSIKT